MATRKPVAPSPQPANLSVQQMVEAIPKLERRIAQLQQADLSTITERVNPAMRSLAQKMDDTLMEIFGNDTIEYNRYRMASFDTTPMQMMVSRFDTGPNAATFRAGYKKGIDDAIARLRTIIEIFEEKIADSGITPATRAAKAFGDLELHPEISRAVGDLYRNGHYSNAVEDACKVLDGLVKLRSQKFDLGGTELMQLVFSPKNPILRFNELKTKTDESEQQGMMYLYAGAMLAFRNPRAHELIDDKPETALEYLGLLSLLAKSLDRATKQ